MRFLKWYLCVKSDSKKISFTSVFGYNGIFTIWKAWRLMKVTLMSKRVCEIVKGLRRAMTQMKLILILVLVIWFVFGLMFNTMMSTKSTREHFAMWTAEEMRNKTEFKLRTMQANNPKNLKFNDTFVGFVNFWWTLFILFQMMTLDQWAHTFKSVQEAHFNPVLGYTPTFCDLHRRVLGDGSGSDRTTWVFIFAGLVLWLWVGNFIFKNLITGIGVNSILVVLNERRWAENEVLYPKIVRG